MVNGFIQKLNAWGKEKKPFLFVVDFELKKPLAFQLEEVNPEEILFYVNGRTNAPELSYPVKPLSFEKFPLPFPLYKSKFDRVMDEIKKGNSYLTNLTMGTPVSANMDLKELFLKSKARYKLCIKNQFLVFSPEAFIQIKGHKIFSYPMKGTIDANIPQAEKAVLENPKERAEHITIVDLIRNDISRIASQVEVPKFRYVEKINTIHKNLLQVSSKISGILPDGAFSSLGSLLCQLLPAGSVCGAPKEKTREIIRRVEGEDRGYYTGVFGIFDGENLDSGVMIRFIESKNGQLVYRSGGGITFQSEVFEEYQELMDKIYVPIN